jgi:hypothetical protein
MEGNFSKRREKLPKAETSSKTSPQTNAESAKRYRDNVRIHNREKYGQILAAKRDKRKLVKAAQLMTRVQQETIREPSLRRFQRSKKKPAALSIQCK